MPGPLRHDNFSVRYFIEMMTIQPDGIFGAPLEVAASYAFLFVLFGNFYNKAGGGQLFFDLASAVTGKMRGGAAKACVTASGLYGSVSGSPTADVATTGPLTDPDHDQAGRAAGARRGDRGDLVERRRDAAAGDGRGGVHHGRHHQHPVLRHRRGVVAAFDPLLRRDLHPGAQRGGAEPRAADARRPDRAAGRRR